MLMIFEPPVVPPFATTGVICADAGLLMLAERGIAQSRVIRNVGIALEFLMTRRRLDILRPAFRPAG
jgi:hypothetical protein